jgi:hypothetical protein
MDAHLGRRSLAAAGAVAAAIACAGPAAAAHHRTPLSTHATRHVTPLVAKQLAQQAR